MSGFSFGNTSAAAPAGGFSFGAPAASTAPAATPFGAPATTSAFGAPAATTGFGAAAPAATPFGSAAAPAASAFGTPAAPATSAFGTTAAAPFSGFGATSTAGSFSFGGAATSTATATPFGAATTTTAPFGAATSTAAPFGAATSTAAPFGAATSTAAPFGAATSTATPFGAAATAAKPLTFGATATAAAPAAAPATGLFNLGAPATGAFGATTAAPFGSFGQTSGLGTLAGTTPAAPAGTGRSMTFEELETKCSEWKKELDLQEEAFLKRATQINAWDRLIISNAEMITQLNEYMKKVKVDQERMDRELDFVVAQQKELEEILVSLEKDANAIEPSSIQHHTDVERETTYNTATTVNAQLRAMTERIKEIIEHINSVNKTGNDTSAMSQITRVLNAHMDALEFIQNGIGTLQQRTDHVSKLMGTVRV